MSASRKVKHKGKDFDVVAHPTNGGKWAAFIDPPGRYVREPDVQTTDPNTGIATTHPGQPVKFDAEDDALDTGEKNIKLGMI